jgi:histidine triad (HIT) family protein
MTKSIPSAPSRLKFFLFVGMAACVGILFVFVGKYFISSHKEMPCAFCEQRIIESQKFYEDDLVLGLVTHKPIVPGHLLVVSKRHVEHFEELTSEEIARIGEVIKKIHVAAGRAYGAVGYLLLQKNSAQAGQTVPHMHVHYIPRKQKESAGLGFILRFFFTPFMPATSEAKMRDTAIKMHLTLSDTAASAQ